MNLFQPVQATEWRPEIAHGETVGFNSHKNKAPDGAKETIRGFFFCRPCRGWFRLIVLPTVSPWAIFDRASGAFLAALILFFAVGATAETTNSLSDAEIQGRALAQKIFELQPTENLTNKGVIKIKDGAGNKSEIRFEMRIKAELTNWYAIYTALSTNNPDNNEELWVAHPSSNKFSYGYSGNKATRFESFANSDFSADDLSLCFLYWSAQKVLPKPTNLVRGREYTLLESTNPNPSTNGYSRVLSWIDKETGGILQAEAYDANGRLLKEFAPKSFKKVNGQWELQEMEIRNVQTGSRTRLEFDLNKQ